MSGWRSVGWGCAIALWAGSLVFGVTTLGVVGPSAPSPGSDVRDYVAQYLAYRRDLFIFEHFQNWAEAVALVLVAALGYGWSQTLTAPKQPWPALFGQLLAAGATVSALTQVAYLGALERILATSRVPAIDPIPLGTLVDVAGRVDDYAENFGYLLMSTGLLGLGLLLRGTVPRLTSMIWLALGIGLLALVGASFLKVGTAGDVSLLVVGAIVAPVWAIDTGRRLDEVSS